MPSLGVSGLIYRKNSQVCVDIYGAFMVNLNLKPLRGTTNLNSRFTLDRLLTLM